MKINCKNPEQVVKRAFWLAYEAAGRSSGMGIFQARGDATEDTVWQNVRSAGDYPEGAAERAGRPGDAYGDYVFGRMLKLGLKWDADSVECRDDDNLPRADYQAWCRKYRTYSELVNTAIVSLGESDARTSENLV